MVGGNGADFIEPGAQRCDRYIVHADARSGGSVAKVEEHILAADLLQHGLRRITVAPDIDHAADLDRSELRMI